MFHYTDSGDNEADTCMAPAIADKTLVAAAGNANAGVFAWYDIDSAAGSGFTLHVRHGEDEGRMGAFWETVAGDHGMLFLAPKSGMFEYTLNCDAFTEGASRVVDEFVVTVTDSGGAAAGEGRLIVYGVNGDYRKGAKSSDIFGITDGKSHVIEGGNGNDLIDLSGSANENVLVWGGGDRGADTVKGFTPGDLTGSGSPGDIIDLRGLLDDLMEGNKGGSLDDIISFSVDNGSTTINIGTDDTSPVRRIVLQDTALSAHDLSGGTYRELARQIMLLTQ